MREYLNDEFYNTFSDTERDRIIEVKDENPDNPWDGTRNGNPAADKILR